MPNVRHISPVDLRLKAITLALEPALMLARIVALPMDDLQKLVATGYYREARRRRMSHRAIARRFGKSLRTVATLAKQAAAESSLLESSESVEQQRRVIEALSRSGTVSRDRLADAIPTSSVSLEETLDLLEEAQLVRLDGDLVHPDAKHVIMLGDDADKRLDSLRHFLGTVTQVVYSRFFAAASDDESFARVLTFSAESDALDTFREGTYGAIRDAAIEADEAADDGSGQLSVAYCVVRPPQGHHWRDRSTG